MAGLGVYRFLLLLCGLMLSSVADDVPDYSGIQAPIVDVRSSDNDRSVRELRACGLPVDNPVTAKWNCTIYNRRIKCQEVCNWGHTLPNGNTMKKFRCNFKDNVWIPSPFEECKKIVQCQIQLASAGSIHCTTNQMDKPDFCNVDCRPFDEFREAPMTKYECNLQSTWTPQLPHCVKRFIDFER